MTPESLIPFIRSGDLVLTANVNGSKFACYIPMGCAACPIGPYNTCAPLRTGSSSISQPKELVPEYFL